MLRRSLLSASSVFAVGGFAFGTKPVLRGTLQLRIVTEGHQNSALWRVYNARTGREIGQDISAHRWAAKFAKAKIGEPFHFTMMRRDPSGKILFAENKISQDRVRGVIVEKV
jgi:hypothetical protein